MTDDENFKNETCIRGAKSIADKCDMGYVMTRISEKTWNTIVPTLKMAARAGSLDPKYIEDLNYRPTHVIDIYKMRRGRYKNVRIWLSLHLGTGYRQDLFMTTADNQPINGILDLFFKSARIDIIDDSIKNCVIKSKQLLLIISSIEFVYLSKIEKNFLLVKV